MISKVYVDSLCDEIGDYFRVIKKIPIGIIPNEKCSEYCNETVEFLYKKLLLLAAIMLVGVIAISFKITVFSALACAKVALKFKRKIRFKKNNIIFFIIILFFFLYFLNGFFFIFFLFNKIN